MGGKNYFLNCLRPAHSISNVGSDRVKTTNLMFKPTLVLLVCDYSVAAAMIDKDTANEFETKSEH